MPSLDTIGASVQQAAINFSGSGNNTVVTGVVGKKIKILQIYLVLGGASNLTFLSGLTALTGLMDFSSNGAFVLDFGQLPLTCVNVLDSFIINSSSGVQVGGTVWYVMS